MLEMRGDICYNNSYCANSIQRKISNVSASKEKKNRGVQRGAGTDKKRNAADAAALEAKKFRRNAIIAVVCIVLVVAVAVAVRVGLLDSVIYRNYTGLTAVKVGNTDYSAAEVDVFYRNTYNNLYNSYGSFASYVFDTSKSLTEQQYTEDQTWAGYLYELTKDNMRQITALYDAATANGYAMTDADQALIDGQMSQVEYYAAMSGLSNVDQYLSALYGKGVDRKVLESVLTKMVVAQGYSEQISDGFSYAQDALDAYYAEHTGELDFIHYYYYLVSTSNVAFDELADGKKADAAREAAETIAGAKDAEAFTEAVAAFAEDAAPTEQYIQGSDLTASYSDYAGWLLDSARKEGDTTVVDTDSGSYALLFVERDGNDYLSKSMRHILIQVEADENYEYTDEAKDAAKARIEEIEAEWKADPTEEHFAELANQYSDDGGSNTTGGLYENIRRKQMVTNINDFLFNETHSVGDTAVVLGESGSYLGWHLVYFAGDGPRYRDYLAENAMRNEDYAAWQDQLVAGYEVSEGSGREYVNLG